MFNQARLKLTVWYLLIIMFVSLSFSAVIFGLVNQEIDRFTHSPRFRIEDLSVDREQIASEAQGRMLVSLLEINGVILLVSGSLGYFLAGKTLKPIAVMLDEQNRFVGDASHELRTPLTALKSMIEVGLRDQKMSLKVSKKLLSDSLEEIDKLTKLSDSLLVLARLDYNHQDLSQVFDSRQLLTETVRKMSPKADRKKIKIISHFVTAQIKGNSQRLSEVFIILLDNAIKYSHPQGKINITSQIIKSHLIIKFIDHGIGISNTDLPHVFDRFYRADSSRLKTDEGGYGLGLSIAQKIIQQHDGRITVTSQSDRGSEFKIILPLFSQNSESKNRILP